MNVIYKSEINTSKLETVIYLTNIQQLYSNTESVNTIIKKAGVISGSDFQIEKNELIDRSTPDNPLFNSIINGNNLIVMNDEAHHVHSEYLTWNKTIVKINNKLKKTSNSRIISQVDFTATPRYLDDQSRLFDHIIYDYPLSSAIKDGIVKFPKIGSLENIPNIETDDFGLMNQYQIQAGIQVREEYETLLEKLGKKAVLFIMADNNRNADQVWNFIVNQYPRYKSSEVLLIHTIDRGNKKGELLDQEETELIQAARTIDNLDNPFKIIVSVLMLKEGWDVKSVVSIIPLRSYQSQILVEQTLGRGLRKQFSLEQKEELTIIEHSSFVPLIRSALISEGLDKDTFEMFKIDAAKQNLPKPGAILVFPEISNIHLNLRIPILSGGYFLETDVFQNLNWNQFPKKQMQIDKIEIRDAKYYEKIYAKDEIIRELDLDFVYYYNINQYLTYLVKRIMKKLHISTSLTQFLPKFKNYIQKDFFDKEIIYSDEEIMKKLNHPLVIKNIYEIFKTKFSELTIKEKEFNKSNQYFEVSQTPNRYVSKKVISNKKSIFNFTEIDSSLEEEFSRYLDKENEIVSFCKITPAMRFYLYYNHNGFLKRYLPDFFVKDINNKFYLVETKGEGFIDKKSTDLKRIVGENWTKRAGEDWTYLFIEENFFKEIGIKLSFQEQVTEIRRQKYVEN
ncbi:MAG: DEAD/DEAH box helicase family protein [Candidatus Heimdallarchaeota archaeon]|nr:DEAD/DEAH box helicase family protein [Candidatus Heimdallarchaeota archaeon]